MILRWETLRIFDFRYPMFSFKFLMNFIAKQKVSMVLTNLLSFSTLSNCSILFFPPFLSKTRFWVKKFLFLVYLGDKMIEDCFEKAKELKIGILYASAQLYIMKFYKKHGFEEYGEIYYDEHVEHISMSKKFQNLIIKRKKILTIL